MQGHTRAEFQHYAETLFIAALGGLLFGIVNFPAGWLAGSMLAVAAAAILGRPATVPKNFARAVFIAVGISLGAAVTPETIKEVWTWPLSMAFLIAGMSCATAATSVYLRHFHGWDATSALLAASPGALSQVMIFAAESGSDVPAIVIVQAVRVVILTVGLPGLHALFGMAVTPPAVATPELTPARVGELAVLILVAALAGLALQRIGFRGGLIFGAMLASAVLHGSGFTTVVLPAWLVKTAMVSLGAVFGSRFVGTTLPLLVRYVAAALGSFGVSIAVAFAFALPVVALLSMPISDVLIAFAPGALDSMMLLALALHLDPVYVGVHHLARFTLVSASLPLLIRTKPRRVSDAS